MKRSLSVFLPVHNAQGTLETVVTELLEVLPDLTPRFEILVINDGSSDDTSEVAHDLARSFPQVHVLRHAGRLGRVAALRTGLAYGVGEIVLVRDEGCQADVQDLRKLWRLIDEYAAVIGRCAAAAPQARGGFGQALREWGLATAQSILGTAAGGSLQLFHRQVAQRMCQEAADCDDLTAELTRHGYRWCEVELRPRTARRATQPFLPTLRGVHRRADTPVNGPSVRPAAEPKRPRYLDRIKAFALGE